jgi:signal transduction histidine kinase
MNSSSEIVTRYLNILVIEDNPSDARLVQVFLQQMDMIEGKMQVCQTMQEALDLLAVHPGFDAIISDLTLPDSKGMETVEALVRARPDQAIIIQTGYNDKEIGLMAVKAGAQDFLVKGAYQPDDLAKTVRYAIERRSILDRLERTQRKAQIGHFEIDLLRGTVTGSAEYCRMLGLGDKGNTFVIADLLSNQPDIRALFNTDCDGTEAQTIERDVEVKLWTETALGKLEATTKWFAIISKVSSDGRSAAGMLQDITQRRETEEIRRQNEVSQQAAQMKEQFIASVSHEMRTPMNAILGMSNLLLDYALPEEQRNYIQSIKQSSELLLGVVNDILTISSLQNNAIHFEENQINLHDLLANIMHIISYKVHEKGLMFELQIEEDVPAELLGDKLRLNQILLNLIGNAIKFTDTGFVRVTVRRLNQDLHQPELCFDVQDTGIGIPADKVDAVFETFTRVKYKDRLYEGTGLGLSITKRLIEQQGGVVSAVSHVGKGSIFTFKLRFKNFSGATAPVLQTPSVPYFDTQTAFKILLAEDNKLNQIVAVKTIERQYPNANIHLAVNGQEAIDLLLKHQIDVVLMDLQMPVLDGTEAVEWIRKNAPANKRNTFILAMTAHAHMGEKGQIEAISVDDFVLKPFEPEQLYTKLAKYARLALDGSVSVYGS